MFTGIIEQLGVIKKITANQSNKTFTIESLFSNELKVDQSVAHNGVCLTVERIDDVLYEVTAIDETLKKTALNDWVEGMQVNLERCMQMNARLDGHIVQGHVDGLAQCIDKITKEGSWEFTFQTATRLDLIVEKGSICINGVSLTAFNVKENEFSVAIIPFTYEHTTFKHLAQGDNVNLEFDIIGKYVQRLAKRD
jgi:riboflavin synthase